MIFSDIDIIKKSAWCIQRLCAYVRDNHEALIDKFMCQFEQYCLKITQMQEQGAKNAIGFIHFSVLRTNILARRHKIRLDAYGENWHLDRTECSGEYDVHEFYSFLDEFTDALEASWKASKGKIKLGDVQRALYNESNMYLLFLAEFIRAGLKIASEEPWFQAVKRHEVFVICVGEYQDKFDIIYKEDTSEKSARSVKQFLESKQVPVYTHEIANGLDLSGGNYDDICFQFSSFCRSDLSNSSFNNCRIIRTNFDKAVMKKVSFENSQLFFTDFSGAILEDVSFDNAQLHRVSFAGATLRRVRFEGAKWTQTLNFDNADLIDTSVPDESKKVG